MEAFVPCIRQATSQVARANPVASPWWGQSHPHRAPGPSGAAKIVSGAATFAAFGLAASSARARASRGPRKTARRGWGDDVSFFDASIKSNVEAAQGLRLVTIEAPADVSKPYERAGQFVQAKADDAAKPSFYAISSAPGGDLEFLIKDAESNDWITGAGVGDLVKLSPAMGKGFDTNCEAWKEADVSQVSLFATGSGISPMRALIESKSLTGKQSRLYYGAREEGNLAYSDRFDEWRQNGIEVIPVLSKGDDSWTGRRGYVQDVMKEDEERGEGFVLSAKHGAVLCGQKDMVVAVRAIYADLGVPEERTLLNF